MKEKFSDVFEDVTKTATKIPTNEYLSNGIYPIIDQGQNYIAGFTNREDGLFTDVPAILFGDHTRIIKYIERPCFLGADGVKLLKPKDKNANHKYLYYVLLKTRLQKSRISIKLSKRGKRRCLKMQIFWIKYWVRGN